MKKPTKKKASKKKPVKEKIIGEIKIPKQYEKFNFVIVGKYVDGVLTEGDGKQPAEKGWQNKLRYLDSKEFQEHIKKGFNYGVQSNNSFITIEGKTYFLVVIDFDKRKFQDEVINKFPETFTTTSGSRKKCCHIYLASDNNKSFKIKDENLDTLADIIGAGNQVIGVGSKHKSGSIYKVVKDIPIAFMPYTEIEAILKPYDKTPKKPKKEKKLYVPKGLASNLSEEMIDSISMEEILVEVGIDTSKNPTNCFAHSSKGGKCFSYNDETAHCFNCDESWNKFSLIREAKNLTDKETFEWFAEKTGRSDDLKKSRKEYAKENSPVETGGFIEKKTKDGNLYNLIGEGKFGKYVKIDCVVDIIRDEYNFVTIFGKTHEDIWVYEDGIYKPSGREIIQTYAENLLNTYAKTKVITEIFNKIKRQTSISREEFDDIPIELLPLKNGILNFKTGKFLEYSPKYYFKTKIDVEYNPKAKCPNWNKFVEETFYPDDVKVVQEWWGFCLYRDYFLKKGLIGVGEGDTGKSVFQNVLLKFFGTKNTSGLNLQKIVKDNNFSKSSLYNKYVNLFDDMSSKDINEGGGLKMVTGRSPITAEYKFGDEFQFINFAKMTFCCNKIPPIKDADDITYYNRWLPIPFDNVVPQSEQDKFLIQKLTTPEELSGILNWALIGLKRILKNSIFSYKKSVKEIKEIMDRSSSPLAEFTFDCLKECKDSKITKEVMFELYTEWSKIKNKSRDTKERLGRNLPRYAKFILDGRQGKVRYWNNVRFIGIGDTYDTIKNSICKQGLLYIYNTGLHIINNKVSYPSQEQNKTDFSKKKTQIPKNIFENSGIKEVLEDEQN